MLFDYDRFDRPQRAPDCRRVHVSRDLAVRGGDQARTDRPGGDLPAAEPPLDDEVARCVAQAVAAMRETR